MAFRKLGRLGTSAVFIVLFVCVCVRLFIFSSTATLFRPFISGLDSHRGGNKPRCKQRARFNDLPRTFSFRTEVFLNGTLLLRDVDRLKEKINLNMRDGKKIAICQIFTVRNLILFLHRIVITQIFNNFTVILQGDRDFFVL